MECLDIPLDLIANIEVANTIFETDDDDGSEEGHGKITDAVDLFFTLTNSGNSTCYTNAAPADIREVRLTTSNENLANDIGSEILYEIEKLEKKKGPKISQSREIIAVNRKSSENCPLLDPSSIGNDLLAIGILGSELGTMNILGTTATPLEQVYGGNPETMGGSPLPAKDSIGDEETQYVNPKDIHYSINKITEANYEALAPPQTPNSDRSQQLQSDTEDEYARQRLLDNPGPKSGRDARDPVERATDILQSDGPQNDNQKVDLDYKEAEHAIYGGDVVLQPLPSTPTPTKPFHDPEVLKFSENSNNSSTSLTKSRPAKGPLMKIKEQEAAKAHGKPNTIIPKVASQKRKKPGLIPKKPSRKANATSSKGSSKPAINGRAKRPEIQPSKSKRPERKVPANHIGRPSPPCAPERKAVKGTKIAEGTAPEPTVTKEEDRVSKDAHERDFPVTVGTVIERFSSNLAEMLGELDDTDHQETIKRQASPHIMSRQDQINPVATEIETPTSSTHQDTGSEEVASLPSQPPKKKRKARQEPVRRSPSLMYHTKAAAEILNHVLVNRNPLVDENLTRKTPIVSFGAKGPLNQGLGSTEMSSAVRRMESKKATSCPAIVETQQVLRGGKRKRVAEELAEMEGMGEQQPSNVQIATASHSERALPLAFQDEQEPIFANASPAEQSLPAFGSQRSRVDEKGSPQASGASYQQRMDFRDIAKKVARDSLIHGRNNANEGEHLNHVVDDCGLPLMQGSSPPALPSIPLSLPRQPNDWPAFSPVAIENVTRYVGRQRPLPGVLRGTAKKKGLAQQLIFAEPNEKQTVSIPVDETVAQYISHKRAMDRELRNIEHEEGLVCQPVLADPFLEKRSKRNLSDFAQRLQQSSEERPTYEPTTGQLRAEPLKRRAGIFDDPEVTLVNIKNQAAPEDISSPSDMTDGSSNEYQDLEQQTLALSFDLTLEDEWRTALKPYQKGVLDALYQISNVSLNQFVLIARIDFTPGSCAISHQPRGSNNRRAQ
jgi:hypothetical protein